MKIRVVLDTNVLLSGWQSHKGASHKVLRRLLDKRFEIAVSVPLVLEYEEILKEKLDSNIFTKENIDGIIDDLCKVGVTAQIFYLWRPFLPDPEDDHILELAVAAHCSYIVTYNKRDFRGVEERFGIEVIDAAEFLLILETTADSNFCKPGMDKATDVSVKSSNTEITASSDARNTINKGEQK